MKRVWVPASALLFLSLLSWCSPARIGTLVVAPEPAAQPEPAPPPVPEPDAMPIRHLAAWDGENLRQKPIMHQAVWRQRGIGLPLETDDPEARAKRVVMLTFDDGPGVGTESILDTLAKYHVPAMFFITRRAMQHPDLVEREYREGHTIAPHSMTHANLTKLTPEQIRQELDPLIDLIRQVTGAPPKYLRPPFGAYNKEVQAVAREYNLEIVNWTHGSLDWDGTDAKGYKDPNQVVEDATRGLYRGSVILFHDTLKQTAEALPDVINRLREAGFEFVVLQ
ncbi:MAG: polysaccharide deacetylase family protein [Mycobacterium leprae]